MPTTNTTIDPRALEALAVAIQAGEELRQARYAGQGHLSEAEEEAIVDRAFRDREHLRAIAARFLA